MRTTIGTLVQAVPERSEESPAPLTGHPKSGGVSRFRFAVWIFAAFQFFYMLTSSGRVRTADEYNTFYMAESLVLRGSTAIPQAVQLRNFYGRLDLQGQPRAAYPPGQAVFCAPWYAFGYYVLSRLPGVPPRDGDFLVWFSTCLSSATFSALTVAFFSLLLTGIGFPPKASLLATVSIGLATPIFSDSAYLFSEPLSAAIFMGVALLIFVRRDSSVSCRVAAIAGLTLGFTVWVRPTNVIAVMIFAVAVLVRDGKSGLRAAAAMCGASAIGVVTLLLRNAHLFGHPFQFGYPDAVRALGVDNSFDTPMLTGLYGFLFSPGKSVFVFAPPIVVAAIGLRRLWRQDRGVASIAILFPVLYLLLFSCYAHWEGGYCVGPRYLVPSIAFFCLGLAPMLAESKPFLKRLAILLFALGATVQCITLATSFLEDQAPSRGRYYDTHWKYRLSYSLSGQMQLFWRYLTQGQPHRLGLGWDRWFVFLHLAGVSGVTLALVALCMVAGLAIGLIGVARTMEARNAVRVSTLEARS